MVAIVLLFASPSDRSLRLAIAYGVFGLLGFLAQMVVGVQARLVPRLAWIQEVTFTAWSLAVPAIAVGFALNAIPLLSAGSWALLAGVITSAAGQWAVAGPALPDFRQGVAQARRVAKTSR
jgi:hypothetical protein